MSLNRFLCLHTHSTFIKLWSLQFFFFFFGKRSYIYIGFALCPVRVICILFQLCFAMLGWRVTNCIPQAPLPDATSGGRWQEMRRRKGQMSLPTHFFSSLGGVFGDCCVPATIPALEAISSSTAPAPKVAAGAQVGPTCLPDIGSGEVAGLGAASCSYLFGSLRHPLSLFQPLHTG